MLLWFLPPIYFFLCAFENKIIAMEEVERRRRREGHTETRKETERDGEREGETHTHRKIHPRGRSGDSGHHRVSCLSVH